MENPVSLIKSHSWSGFYSHGDTFYYQFMHQNLDSVTHSSNPTRNMTTDKSEIYPL